jgi:hypothetical protein
MDSNENLIPFGDVYEPDKFLKLKESGHLIDIEKLEEYKTGWRKANPGHLGRTTGKESEC